MGPVDDVAVGTSVCVVWVVVTMRLWLGVDLFMIVESDVALEADGRAGIESAEPASIEYSMCCVIV